MGRPKRILPLSVLMLGLALGGCAAPRPQVAPGSGRESSPGATAAVVGRESGAAAADFGDSVFFPPATADLTHDARRQLAGWAAVLRGDPGDAVTIVGHGDERSTREYSLALGAERAYAVKAYLVALGVPARQLTTTTYGKERPAAAGFSREARALDRRAVLDFPSIAAVPR